MQVCKISRLDRISLVTSLAVIVILSVGFALRYQAQAAKTRLSYIEVMNTGFAIQFHERLGIYNKRLIDEKVSEAFPDDDLPSPSPQPAPPLYKHPPLYPWLISRIPFGFEGFPGVSLIAGCLSILAVFLLGKDLYGVRTGLLAACFLTIEPAHWISSSKIWMATTLALWMFLSIHFFYKGLKQNHFFLLCGLMCGLALLTKYVGLLSIGIILAFALLYERRLLKTRAFWMIFVITSLVFLPWMLWNFIVYGPSFVQTMLSFHGSGENWKLIYYVGGVFAALTAIAAVIGIRPNKKQSIPSPHRKTNWAFPALVLCVLLLSSTRLFGALLGMLEWNHLPPYADELAGIKYLNRHTAVYFLQPLLLSPLYLGAYLGLFFLGFRQQKEDMLLALAASTILLFFTFYGEYETRYALGAVPFLMLISARFVVIIWEKLIKLPLTIKTFPLHALFFVVLGYAIAKTIKVGYGLSLAPAIFF